MTEFRITGEFVSPSRKPCEGAELKGGDWFLDVPDFNDLMSFVEQYNCMVLYEDEVIEIYEDWKE